MWLLLQPGILPSVIYDAIGRWSALQVVHLWDAPDVVVEFLQSGDESLRDEARVMAVAVAVWAQLNKLKELIISYQNGETGVVRFPLPSR